MPVKTAAKEVGHDWMPLAGGALLQHLRAKHGWSDRQVDNAKRDGEKGMARASKAHRLAHGRPKDA